MAQMHGARLKYLRNGLTMLEMAKNLTNGFNLWEMTYIFGNWLKCLRNGQNIWEMTLTCGKWLKYVGK